MKKQLRKKRRQLIILIFLLLSLASFAVAKYIKTIGLSNNTVTFTAKLAQTFELRESIVQQQANGIYTLSSETTASGSQRYVLIPGLDVPKDPHIVIEGKTEIPAYLYIEIVNTLDTVVIDGESVKLIDYVVSSDWKVSSRLGQHGGTVYVYTGGENNAKELSGTPPDMVIYILHANTVTVSPHIKHADITADSDTDILTFYAYLEEVIPENP